MVGPIKDLFSSGLRGVVEKEEGIEDKESEVFLSLESLEIDRVENSSEICEGGGDEAKVSTSEQICRVVNFSGWFSGQMVEKEKKHNLQDVQ